MKYTFLLITILLFFSCGKEKVILLPEIKHSEITEILDVSPAYLFYDETQKDSVELNRKNLIVTTNWLVNVDKRLTLKQVIPYIKFIQEKKRNSSHKNEKAKNYFTCNDTSRKNLGFIEFTDVFYHNDSATDYFSKKSDLQTSEPSIGINVDLNNNITIINPESDPFIIQTNKENLISDLKKTPANIKMVFLNFNSALTFQDYISFKSLISSLKNKSIHISNNEFIY
ncbi:hypothetical protein [Hwangdonia lutea]|uniref:Lipoprotein n=1 Tax=Hwangdonia lutea TaxID=3075823 RepID=A0AA97EM00_9FLAO|nr:hypothetical protein [Hwangdonia sp. SCSIO 19198]WOD42458.1 hypothetical protein RNZ46_10685 [Hwangdonia sp. SCSIO 19198]